jgi:hypothetical protein
LGSFGSSLWPRAWNMPISAMMVGVRAWPFGLVKEERVQVSLGVQ